MRRPFWLVAMVLVAGCSPTTLLPPITQVGTAGTDAPVTSATTPTATSLTPLPDDSTEERIAMVESQIEARGITNPNVLEAMRTVPRHRFVADDNKGDAYGDHPLPIGYGQTISQPFIVAMMSEALDVGPGDKVLEIGTGSGYQAAVLAAMGCEVYTMEIIPELAVRAEATLNELGYDVTVGSTDGYFGWSEHAPFDGIIVTAAPDHVPQPLIEQLKPGAALVIPVGPVGAMQTMWRFSVDEDGLVTGENLGSVIFVPFTRAEG
ncbi:MAG: protein-L-isoaspartate(D-aspartate) O-methyltransferase [Acidimicrobiia bacterium]|nr:protein-L-isoaspartate(D-aspartate) O-methyltransferase [Acidimicrobiia bacterium]